MPDTHTGEYNGDEEGDKEYAVRLLFNVSAYNPEHAAQRFVDQVNTYGMKSWVYRVVELGNLDQFMVHPADEVTYTLQEFEERMINGDDMPNLPESADVEDVATDGQL